MSNPCVNEYLNKKSIEGTDFYNYLEQFFEMKRNGLIKKRYFKTNKKVFTFMNKHPEFRIEHIYMTKKNIAVLYSNKLGRPYKVHDESTKFIVKPYIKSHAITYRKEVL